MEGPWYLRACGFHGMQVLVFLLGPREHSVTMTVTGVFESWITFNVFIQFTEGRGVQSIYFYGSVSAIKGLCPEQVGLFPRRNKVLYSGQNALAE
jgi:hypothetical protein